MDYSFPNFSNAQAVCELYTVNATILLLAGIDQPCSQALDQPRSQALSLLKRRESLGTRLGVDVPEEQFRLQSSSLLHACVVKKAKGSGVENGLKN